MSLRDREIKPARAHRRYRIEVVLEELEEEDRVVLEEWLRDLRYSPERIKDALEEEKIYVSEGAIARYRSTFLKIGDRKL